MKLFWLVLMTVILCPQLSLAQDSVENQAPNGNNVVHLPISDLVVAKKYFQEYLERDLHSEGVLSIKANNISGISALIMMIDLIEPHLHQPASAQIRIKTMLELLKIVLSTSHLSAADKELVRERLAPFLERYSDPAIRSNQLLVSIYSRYGLWTAFELPFLRQQMKTSADVLKHFSAVLVLGKELNTDQLLELNETLANVKPYTLAPLLLQYELRLLGPQQLTLLLQNIYGELRPVSYGTEIDTYKPNHNVAVRASAIKVLQEIQDLYNAKDENVLKVIEQRIAKAKNAEARVFFSLFAENGFTNLAFRHPRLDDVFDRDPLDIREKIIASEAAAMSPVNLIESRTENVLRVNFAGANCMQIFSTH